MRKLFLLTIIFTLILSVPGCSVFKHNTKETSLGSIKQKNDIEVKKEASTVKVTEKKGISEESNTDYTEEITYKKAVPSPIELTATFRIDTNATLSGDTALKLVDINNSDISVAIYQNKKTNELMAKVSTGKSTKSMPFDELQIKRNYSNNTVKKDTSKMDSSASNLKLDSSDHSKTKISNKDVKTESKPSGIGMWAIIGIALVIVGGIIVYKKFF